MISVSWRSSFHASLCILTIFPVLAPLHLLLLLLSSHPSQPMTADQPTWHSHLAFPSGSKREVSFGHFIKHSYTAWCYSVLHCVLTCVTLDMSACITLRIWWLSLISYSSWHRVFISKERDVCSAEIISMQKLAATYLACFAVCTVCDIQQLHVVPMFWFRLLLLYQYI